MAPKRKATSAAGSSAPQQPSADKLGNDRSISPAKRTGRKRKAGNLPPPAPESKKSKTDKGNAVNQSPSAAQMKGKSKSHRSPQKEDSKSSGSKQKNGTTTEKKQSRKRKAEEENVSSKVKRSKKDEESYPDSPTQENDFEAELEDDEFDLEELEAEDDEDQYFQNDDDEEEVNCDPEKPVKRDHRGALPGQKITDAWKEQAEFVIRLRDNYDPGPDGVSKTYGPIGYRKIHKLFMEKFQIKRCFNGMEKRYRLKKGRFLKDHPEWPKKIQYTPRPVVVDDEHPEGEEGDGEKEDEVEKDLFEDVNDDGEENSDDEGNPNNPRKAKANEPRGRIGGYIPPDDVRNDADIRNYFDSAKPSKANELPKWIPIFVSHRCGHVLERLEVPTKHFRRTSKEVNRQILLDQCYKVETNHRMTIVERYVQCISPVRLNSLPLYLFTMELYNQPDGSLDYEPLVTPLNPIEWDFEDLVDLYNLATDLRDDHVRNLVLDYWRDLWFTCREFDLDDKLLSKLFRGKRPDDMACKFWQLLLFTQGSTLVKTPGQDRFTFWSLDTLPANIAMEITTHYSAMNIKELNKAGDRHFCQRFHKHRWEESCPIPATGNFNPDFEAIGLRLERTRILNDRMTNPDGTLPIIRLANHGYIADSLREQFNVAAAQDRDMLAAVNENAEGMPEETDEEDDINDDELNENEDSEEYASEDCGTEDTYSPPPEERDENYFGWGGFTEGDMDNEYYGAEDDANDGMEYEAKEY